MIRSASLLGLLATPVAASAADLETIPARFHGHWSLSAEQCTANPLDDASVRVGARFFKDFQERLDVRSVSIQGKDEIIAAGRMTGAGEPYDYSKRLALFDNATRLGVGEGEDYSVYVRCES
jgi:hypothetical protein